jgi:hypothetical protein
VSAVATDAHSVVEPTPRARALAGTVVVAYAILSLLPLLWIFATGFKTPPDSISYPPKLVFTPTLEGYVNVFTTRSRQTPEYMASLPPAETWYDDLVRSRSMVIAGPSKFGQRFLNSGGDRLRLHVPLRPPRHARGLRLLALPRAAEGRPAVLHPLDPVHAADRGGDPDLPDVPDTWPAPTRGSA